MNYNINISLEISADSYKQILEGTDLLNASINYDRACSGKNPVCIHEDYFLRQAIWAYLESLRNDMKTENFN